MLSLILILNLTFFLIAFDSHRQSEAFLEDIPKILDTTEIAEINIQENHPPNSIPTFSRSKCYDDLLKNATKMFSRSNISMDGAESAMQDFGEVLNIVSKYVYSEMMDVAHLIPKDSQTLLQEKATHVSEKIKSFLDPMNTEQK